MKKQILVTFLAISGVSITVNAQMPYTLTVKKEAYQPLTNATSINDTVIWNDESYSVPIGFDFKLGGKAINSVNIIDGTYIGSDPAAVMSSFLAAGSDFTDRGSLDTVTKSPLRYTVSGTTGSRIFKYEMFNAGFVDEMTNHNTLEDSVNLQVWFYEGTNVVELRYGASKISHEQEYFALGGPMVGYIKNVDPNTGDYEMFYLLDGDPMSPVIDSLEDGSFDFPFLAAYPDSGTVYRFTPITSGTSVNDVFAGKMKVYPTQCSDAIYIQNEDVNNTYYQVISAMGTVVKNGKVEKGRNRIDISNLASGMYVLRMDNVVGHDQRKFVKL